MDFNLLTNEDIIKELGKNYEELRFIKNFQMKMFIKKVVLVLMLSKD